MSKSDPLYGFYEPAEKQQYAVPGKLNDFIQFWNRITSGLAVYPFYREEEADRELFYQFNYYVKLELPHETIRDQIYPLRVPESSCAMKTLHALLLDREHTKAII